MSILSRSLSGYGLPHTNGQGDGIRHHFTRILCVFQVWTYSLSSIWIFILFTIPNSTKIFICPLKSLKCHLLYGVLCHPPGITSFLLSSVSTCFWRPSVCLSNHVSRLQTPLGQTPLSPLPCCACQAQLQVRRKQEAKTRDPWASAWVWWLMKYFYRWVAYYLSSNFLPLKISLSFLAGPSWGSNWRWYVFDLSGVGRLEQL